MEKDICQECSCEQEGECCGRGLSDFFTGLILGVFITAIAWIIFS